MLCACTPRNDGVFFVWGRNDAWNDSSKTHGLERKVLATLHKCTVTAITLEFVSTTWSSVDGPRMNSQSTHEILFAIQDLTRRALCVCTFIFNAGESHRSRTVLRRYISLSLLASFRLETTLHPLSDPSSLSVVGHAFVLLPSHTQPLPSPRPLGPLLSPGAVGHHSRQFRPDPYPVPPSFDLDGAHVSGRCGVQPTLFPICFHSYTSSIGCASTR